MLTDWFRREELKTDFLELRSKMRDIYLSWNVSSCDQVGRNCYALFFLVFTRLWQPSLVVSQQALKTFLIRPIDKLDAGSTHQVDQSEPSSNSQSQTSLNGVKSNGSEISTRPLASFMAGEISVEEILCPHGRLDPGKAADMKRIDRVRPYPTSHIISLMFTIIQATYESLILASGASFEPRLEPTDICHKCVEDTFLGTSIYPILRF
jgi:hypothetical protein